MISFISFDQSLIFSVLNNFNNYFYRNHIQSNIYQIKSFFLYYDSNYFLKYFLFKNTLK
jgi:hypothetical protein